MTLADSSGDQLPQQIPGFSQSFFPGRTIRGAPTEVRKRDDETAIGIALDLCGIAACHRSVRFVVGFQSLPRPGQRASHALKRSFMSSRLSLHHSQSFCRVRPMLPG